MTDDREETLRVWCLIIGMLIGWATMWWAMRLPPGCEPYCAYDAIEQSNLIDGDDEDDSTTEPI